MHPQGHEKACDGMDAAKEIAGAGQGHNRGVAVVLV